MRELLLRFLWGSIVRALFLVAIVSVDASEGPGLEMEMEEGTLVLRGNSKSGELSVLERSMTLRDWVPMFVSSALTWEYAEALELIGENGVFFRTRGTSPPAIEVDDSWTDQIDLTSERYFSEPKSNGSSSLRFVKFTILTDNLKTVYFQDSDLYPFHYSFAVEKLGPFVGMELDRFNELTLYLQGQEAILGEVLLNEATSEYGIRFVAKDGLPPGLVAYLYHLVDAALIKDSALQDRGYYMPNAEQAEHISLHEAFFRDQGIRVASSDIWSLGSQCYSQGWAMGRLRFVETERIEEAYLSGELTHSDVLLTDGVPAELPFLAGVLTLSPASPGSHVSILAESYGIPFAYIGTEKELSMALDLVDQEVLYDVGARCRIHLLGTDDVLTDEVRAYLSGLGSQREIEVRAKTRLGKYSENVASLEPSDIVYFGGKASAFGFLLREIPENTRGRARAFSFDLWDAFMDQGMDSGSTLRQEIEAVLSAYSWPVSDLRDLQSDLSFIQDRIEDDAVFDQRLRTEILQTLAVFDENRKIRFRSSTNVEDSEAFSGAGLYESKSGCLGDDLDLDEAGPSICDPTKSNERGVFRAMKKVYASFYGLNAYLERLRHGVDEVEVGMAVLAHHSYPDEIEMANGVVRYDFTSTSRKMRAISQPGAFSVTNPEPGELPEIARLGSFGRAFVEQRSGLLEEGSDSVLEDDDYLLLSELVRTLGDAYRSYFELAEEERILLEFEYKKVKPGNIEIKQIRLIPEVDRGGGEKVLIGGTASFFRQHMGERNSSVERTSQLKRVVNSEFEAHYMNMAFEMEFESRILSGDNVFADPVLKGMQWMYQGNGDIQNWSGDPTALPGFEWEEDESGLRYSWSLGDSDFELTAAFDRRWWDSDPQATLVFADTLSLEVRREYLKERRAGVHRITHPKLSFVDMFRRSFQASFISSFGVGTRYDKAALVRVSVEGLGGVLVESSFYFPPSPSFSGGYTAPLTGWDKTTITGLASEPIVLRSRYSQSYAPEHHNFTEWFLFEPRLEEGISRELLEELEALDVMQIYLMRSSIDRENPATLRLIGFDGVMREERL